MALRSWGSGLHTIDHPFTTGGLDLGTRTTIAEVAPRALVLVSPGPLSDEDIAGIRKLGDVTAIIAPNDRHHMFAVTAKQAFTGATLHAHQTLKKKLPDLPVDAPLEGSPWGAAFEGIFIGGMPSVNETAFVHAASRTLVLTDVAFNIRPPKPWLTRTMMKVNRGWDRFGMTRLGRSMVKDPAALSRCIGEVLRRDFDRVVVAHGEVLETGGKQAMRGAFELGA